MTSWLFWALSGLLLLAGHAIASEHSSSGDSGDTCGPKDRKCIEGEASCDAVSGKCVCHNPPFFFGDGYRNCYKNNTYRTEVFNDPNVMTYNDNSISLPLPCRYFLTHIMTYLDPRYYSEYYDHGMCEFQVYAFNHKDKGKFYVAGYDVAIRLKFVYGDPKLISIRKSGTAYNGSYNFIVNATDGAFSPNGPWYNDQIYYHEDYMTNLKIEPIFDDVNNLAILRVRECGIEIQFRPYDTYLRADQPQEPHVTFGISSGYHPTFQSRDKVIAIPPANENDGKTIDDLLLPGLDREETLIVRALNSMAAQNAPQPNQQCAVATSVIAQCNVFELAEALPNCKFILKLPRFVKCYDDGLGSTIVDYGESIMGLFNRCIEIYCDGRSCGDVIADIQSSGCDALTPPYPEVTEFVSGSKCP